MISCAYTFSVMATKYQYINGVVDYAEATMGKKICLLCRLVYGCNLLSHNHLGACMGLRPVHLCNLWLFHYRRRMYDHRLPLPYFKLYNECFVSCSGREISGEHHGH